MDMTKLRLPIMGVIALVVQSSGVVWFFAQQSQTIQTVESDVAALLDRVSVERLINDERDILDNQNAVTAVVDDVDELASQLIRTANSVDLLDRRVQSVEIQIRYIGAPYGGSLSGSADPHSYNAKDGM